jgi:hypothetical protein
MVSHEVSYFGTKNPGKRQANANGHNQQKDNLITTRKIIQPFHHLLVIVIKVRMSITHGTE